MGETRGKAPIDLALLSSGLKAGCAPTNKKPPHSRVIQLVVTMTKDRVNEIDLLRFIAAIVVLFFHYSFRGACLRRSVHHALPLDYSSCKVWISGGGSAVFHDQRLRDIHDGFKCESQVIRNLQDRSALPHILRHVAPLRSLQSC